MLAERPRPLAAVLPTGFRDRTDAFLTGAPSFLAPAAGFFAGAARFFADATTFFAGDFDRRAAGAAAGRLAAVRAGLDFALAAAGRLAAVRAGLDFALAAAGRLAAVRAGLDFALAAAGRLAAVRAGLDFALAAGRAADLLARAGFDAAAGRFDRALGFGLAAGLARADPVVDVCFDGFFRGAIISSSAKNVPSR